MALSGVSGLFGLEGSCAIHLRFIRGLAGLLSFGTVSHAKYLVDLFDIATDGAHCEVQLLGDLTCGHALFTPQARYLADPRGELAVFWATNYSYLVWQEPVLATEPRHDPGGKHAETLLSSDDGGADARTDLILPNNSCRAGSNRLQGQCFVLAHGHSQDLDPRDELTGLCDEVGHVYFRLLIGKVDEDDLRLSL